MRLIDADAFCKALEEEYHGMISEECLHIYEILRRINEQPTIDNAPTVETKQLEYKAYNEGYKDGVDQGIKLSKRPHGEWVIDGHHIRCNKCNEYICRQDLEGAVIPNNFCPNCGAYMRKGGAV